MRGACSKRRDSNNKRKRWNLRSEMLKTKTTKRVDWVDGCKGLAIVLVVYGHPLFSVAARAALVRAGVHAPLPCIVVCVAAGFSLRSFWPWAASGWNSPGFFSGRTKG